MANKIVIQVTMDMETNQIEVKGPLDAKPVVCKILASAITAVIDHAPPVIRPLNNGGKKGNGLEILRPN